MHVEEIQSHTKLHHNLTIGLQESLLYMTISFPSVLKTNAYGPDTTSSLYAFESTSHLHQGA